LIFQSGSIVEKLDFEFFDFLVSFLIVFWSRLPAKMSHLKTYHIFPDKWVKNWTESELNNARLTLKAYVTNRETELSIREVSTKFFHFRDVSKGRKP